MEKQCSNREGFSDSPWMKKQVICSLFPQCPLNEHILNGPNQKQTNFSSFSLSEKQKPFPVGYWQNSEMNRVHEKCSNEKNNWGRWTNHSASSEANFTTFEKQQTAAPPACLPIYLLTKKLLGSKAPCLQISTILHLRYCKTWPVSREISTLRYPLCTVKRGRSFCLVT